MSSTPPALRTLPAGRAIWTVAWPMVVLGWVRSLYLVVDTWWVGRLGADELIAMGVASFAWWMLVQFGELPALGVHALVARSEGAERRHDSAGILVHGLLVGLVLWVLVAASVALWAPAYLRAMGVDEGVTWALGRSFLTASAVASLGTTVHAVVGGVFRGLGHTRVALGMTGLGLLVNVGLDPLLMWGWGPVPAMGLDGAAWATGLSSLASTAVGAAWLRGRGLGRARWGLHRPLVRSIVAIGAPISLTGVGFSLVYVLLGRLITSLGEQHMAALGVGHRLESFAYLAGVGISVATATLLGQHLGAGDLGGAQRAVRTAERWCTVIMVAFGGLGFVLARPLYQAFTDDPGIVDAGVVYFRFQAAVWVFMGLEQIYEGAFTGAARTAPAMWIGGTLTAARIPVAWFLAYPCGLGVTGIWAAIAVSTLAKGVLLRWWFWRGTWREVVDA